jgi:phosphoglycolate phosphatase
VNDIKIVLFDLDGTLTDPKIGITRSIEYALDKMKIRRSGNESFLDFICPPLLDSFRDGFSLDETRAREAVQFYREYFSVIGIFENEIYRGIPQLLARLKNKNLQLICATSKPTVYAEKILVHFDIRRYMDMVVGSNLDLTHTDKAEIIASILMGFPHYPPSNFVMVGDRAADIIGARKNRTTSIGVTYGYGSYEELKKAGPDIIVDSVEGLNRVL